MTRDPLDDLGSADQGLAELFGLLTSEPSAGELAGEHAALAMFRAAGPPAPARARRVRRSRARVGGWLVAGATVVVFGSGFAAAGYAQVLPAPLQHLAHQILGFAGVSNPPGHSPTPTVPVSSNHRTAGSGSPRPGTSAPSPSPGSSGRNSPSPRSSSPSPRRTSSASPSPSRGGSHSPSASPTPPLPTPAISVTLQPPSNSHGSYTILISEQGAQQNDFVWLEELVSGQWQKLRQHQLHPGGPVSFSVSPRKISVTYRVVLPATAKHGQAVSNSVTVPARAKGGGNGSGGGKGSGGG